MSCCTYKKTYNLYGEVELRCNDLFDAFQFARLARHRDRSDWPISKRRADLFSKNC